MFSLVKPARVPAWSKLTCSYAYHTARVANLLVQEMFHEYSERSGSFVNTCINQGSTEMLPAVSAEFSNGFVQLGALRLNR